MSAHFFTEQDVRTLEQSRRSMTQIECAAFCSFESRFARSGGLAAVTDRILPYLKESGPAANVILVTPFHARIIRPDKLKLIKTGRFRFGEKSLKLEIHEYVNKYNKPVPGQIREYFIRVPGHFMAKNALNDPYIYDTEDAERNNALLLTDALVFSKAVPAAMALLGKKRVLLHLQDWETILAGMTSKIAVLQGELKACSSVFTMHNPYDSGWIRPDLLAKITDGKIASLPQGATALGLGLQFIDAPVTTVSRNFAGELLSDIVHTQYFIPHIQILLRDRGLTGINNGMFIDFPESYEELNRINAKTVGRVRAHKETIRKELLHILDNYRPEKRFGDLTWQGGPLANMPPEIPIIVMSGRLDPNQKGYDLLLRAVDRFDRDQVKAVFTPMAVNASDLEYFREKVLGSDKGNMTVFPMRMEKGYMELQTGSTYGIMPSVYEPFGAAIEYMANGTPVIARNTGGLPDQIDARQKDFLYREPAAHYRREFIEAFFGSRNRVKDREQNPWASDMTDSLYETIKKAVLFYQRHTDAYYRCILHGFRKARTFDWSKSAKAYSKIYQKTLS
ncbi:glycogen/starch synthase [bacterium]|nr:glycogen/starch synthase [bacterium]